MATPDDDDVELAAGLDDDALDELQELLWRGYVPARYPRMEPAERIIYHAGLNRRRPSKQPFRHVPPPPPPPSPPYVRFQCDRCERWMWVPADDVEAEAEYHATFGEAATADRLALCEPCFEIMMKGRH